jgi:hypothetical protein
LTGLIWFWLHKTEIEKIKLNQTGKKPSQTNLNRFCPKKPNRTETGQFEPISVLKKIISV